MSIAEQPVSSAQSLAEAARQDRRGTRWSRIRKRINWLGLFGILVVLFFVMIAACAPVLTDKDPKRQNLRVVLQSPSREYPFGTDQLGRDVYSRMLYGARITLTIALVAATAGMVIGVVIGLNAGYFGGYLDAFLMRSVDVLLAFPGILLALTLVTILGFGIDKITIAIAVVSIPAFARLARSSTLSIKSMEYVVAAQASGASNTRLLWRHLFPNMMATVVTLWALRLGTSILTASGLGFLGLGVQPPTPEWGAMLSEARVYMQIASHLVTIPGLAITLVVLGFALAGDYLRDLMDPRTR